MEIEKQVSESSLSGFGAHTQQEVEQLQKALSIGSEYSTTTPGNLSQGAALAVEDLDRTLKLVTHGMEHIKLWKDIIKEKVSQTVHEFNIQNRYGQEVSPFFAMGGTPQATDAGYNRDVALVKYLGTQGQVQHNLTLIQAAHGPVVAREVKNKTIELIARNERALFEANSSINSLEYDGVEQSIVSRQSNAKFKAAAFEGYNGVGVDDSVIIDQRGNPLDEDVSEEACLRAVNNFGMPMDSYLSTDIHSRFSRTFYAKQVTRPGDSSNAGYRVPAFDGTLQFRFKGNLFNRPRRAPLASTVSAQSAPVISATAVVTDAASQFATADAGNYSYVISAVYSDGETLPSAQATQAVTAGKKVQATPTYSGSPLFLLIFRAPIGTTSAWENIGRVAPQGSGVACDIDFNANLPGLGKMYLLMHDPDALCFKQLGSMIKYDLAVTDTSYKWLQLLYGMVVVQAPRKHIIVKNISLS